VQVDEPRRNDAFDRELRRALAAEGGAAPGPHVDAERAAAWMDRQLDAAAARSIEAHLADCPDCQALMATLARLAPDVPAAGEGFAWWRRLRAGWLVPATVAAAAALVIWVAVPQQRSAQKSDSLQTFGGAPAAAPQPAPPTVQPTQPAAPAAAPATSNDASARAVAPPPAEFQKKAADLQQRRPQGFADQAALPPPAPPAPPAAPAPALERRADAATQDADARVVAETPTVDALAGRRGNVAGGIPAPAPPPARQEAAAERQRALNESVAVGAAQGATSTLRAAAGLLTVASDGGARWRRTGSTIEFAPRDTSFVAASLPVSADALVAASAPGGTVCWMAGRAGIVVVTTDGTRFIRTAVPTPSDLVAVTATDARTAIVTAADGRRFRTADQGATWSLLP
jgi:hypothetical protein